MAKTTLTFKVCMLGSTGVGKSSIIKRATKNNFYNNIPPTIGAAYSPLILNVDNHIIRFQIWDTAGQEAFKSIVPMYYRKTNVAIIVFDITCWNSYKEVATWVEELKSNLSEEFVLCVIGNKNDMETNRKVNKLTACNFAFSLGAMYFETSAKTNDGIKNVFFQLAKQLILYNKKRGNRHNEEYSVSNGNTKIIPPKTTSTCCNL